MQILGFSAITLEGFVFGGSYPHHVLLVDEKLVEDCQRTWPQLLEIVN